MDVGFSVGHSFNRASFASRGGSIPELTALSYNSSKGKRYCWSGRMFGVVSSSKYP